MAKGAYTGSGLHYSADPPSVSKLMTTNVIVASGSTNAVVIAGEAGRTIRVLALAIGPAGAAVELTLGSNDTTATPKWGPFRLPATNFVTQYGDFGLFDCVEGESLVATNGAVNVTVFVNYVFV